MSGHNDRGACAVDGLSAVEQQLVDSRRHDGDGTDQKGVGEGEGPRRSCVGALKGGRVIKLLSVLDSNPMTSIVIILLRTNLPSMLISHSPREPMHSCS